MSRILLILQDKFKLNMFYTYLFKLVIEKEFCCKQTVQAELLLGAG